MIMTTKWLLRAGPVLTIAFLAAMVSCTSEKKAPDKEAKAISPDVNQDSTGGGTSSVSYTPGEAGGMAEETVSASATVKAIDPATRKITLSTQDGNQATFTAPAEVRNFDQIRVGDKLNATIHQRLVVYVDRDEREPSAVHAAALAKAPQGAKPGAIVAENFEVIATVTAIDSASRRATLRFSDGQTKTIPVRQDVDLTKYKVGNSVVIQITQELALLVEAP
jgi:Cu/Ag efflux protein CusF